MTNKETAQVMAMIHAVYPQREPLTDDALRAKLSVWQEIFADEPLDVVQAGVKAFIASDTKGFLPVPGQIKEQISLLKNRTEMTEQEAWDMVTNALKNSAYNSNEEYGKLPEDIKRAVGSANMLKSWASVNYSELHTIIAAQFKNAYRAVVAKRKSLDKIPTQVKAIAPHEKQILLESGTQECN